MPISTSTQEDLVPSKIRAYIFHGVQLDYSGGGTHAIGDCPFCGKEGKLSIEIDTGVGKCWACGTGTENGGLNPLVFIRMVYERAASTTTPERLEAAAKDRRLTSVDTLINWGVRFDARGTWLVPGYNEEGCLDQVYRRIDGRLMPTPRLWPEGKGHFLHMPAARFDPAHPELLICEGPWDGMILDEVAYPKSPSNIVAVPGCGVWRDEWTEMCRGKVVTLFYDSDHPRTVLNHVSTPGYDGMKRVAGRLSGVAATVRFLKWGEGGFCRSLPDGWDVRDELSAADDRVEALAGILARVEDVPREWLTVPVHQASHTGSAEAEPCSTWVECEEAWRDAMWWRDDLRDALAVSLAVCASTSQAGNQLFVDLIGSPGSAKTTLCQGLLMSQHCIHLENVTKLVSGYRSPEDGDKDCSFLARSNNKTWITCEFDVLGSSHEYHQLMGKVRRIFDGEMTSTYGNSDKDRVYSALRTPWIRAGTHKMMDRMNDSDQSQLGDRFMRFIIGDPVDSDRRSIARRALRSERVALLERANGTTASLVDPRTRKAQALTGGYVDWLRENVDHKLQGVAVSDEVEDYCISLAELSADLRARPSEDKRKTEAHDVKELPTRLSRQYIRMAMCLAVVLNKTSVDDQVLRILRKVALDTAFGNSLKITQWLCSTNPGGAGRSYQDTGGIPEITLRVWLGITADRLDKYLTFLRKIDVVKWNQATSSWVLTDRVHSLYLQIYRI